MSWVTHYFLDNLPINEALFFANIGMATPDGMGIINILGSHNIETSGVTDTITIIDTNTHTLGDLTPLGENDNALLAQTGDVSITQGNLKLANNYTGGGILFKGNSRYLYSRSDAGKTDLFLGENSGNTSTIPGHNIGLGNASLNSIVNSEGNVSIGWNAGLSHSNATGFNTYIGGSCARTNNGSFNTGIGFTCWWDLDSSPTDGLRTGNNNIAIGYFAAREYRTNESSNIQIANLTDGNGDNNTIRIGQPPFGFFPGHNRFFIAGVHGVNTSNPQRVVRNNSLRLGSTPFSGPVPLSSAANVRLSFTESNVTGAGAIHVVGSVNGWAIVNEKGTDFSGTQYTIPQDGLYFLVCRFQTRVDNSGMNFSQFSMVTTPKTFHGYTTAAWSIRDSFGDDLGTLVSNITNLDVGDTIHLTYQVSGGAGNTAQIQSSTNTSILSIVYLGS